MKAIILAGGYATRLMPLTRHIPKPLLPVDGKPVIDYIVDQLNQVKEVDIIIVSTNRHYENNFKYWLRTLPKHSKEIKLVCDPSSTDKEKLGAIATIQYVIQMEAVMNEELLVVAGDNIFEFSLVDFIDFYKRHNRPVLALCDFSDKNSNELTHYGLGMLDQNNRVIEFQEKPQVPRSTWVATGVYVYPRDIQKYLQEYLKDKNNPDAPGYFIEWLHKRVEVYGFTSDKTWYDIGSIESFDQVNEYFKNKNSNC